MIKSINPFTGEIIKEYHPHSKAEVEERIQQGQLAFKAWREEPLPARIELVENLGSQLLAKKKSLAELAVREMGKPISQAIAEVEKCAWLCRHYAEYAEEYLAPITVNTDARESRVAFEPLGLVLAIMPWNFPYWQVLRFAVPTLLAGNTALLKHASNVTGCAEAIEDLFRKAGFPFGIFSHIKVSGSEMSGIIGHESIKAVSLTGSEKAGKAVAAEAGKFLKKCVLELGGSNAFVILKDADIESIIDAAVFGRIQNNGQSCIAAKRFIVEAPVYDEFKLLLQKRFEELVTGDPLDEKVDLGPLARVDLAEDLEAQMKKSIDMGARLLTGGKREKALFYPAILEGVAPGMPAFDEETFGPLATLTKVNSADEAIVLANRSRYGLGATICTSDISYGLLLGSRIEDGAVFINDMVKSDPRLPFGGTKQSGHGRELGVFGIREFTNVKTYYVK